MTNQTFEPGATLNSDDPVYTTDGVSVFRRALLWLPALAVGSSVASGAALGDPALEMPTKQTSEDALLAPLTLDALGSRWQKLAAELLAASPDADESYAAQLTGWIARLPAVALPRLEKEPGPSGVVGGPCWFAEPGLAIGFRMEPGAELRLHNHPPQIVVTLCVEGEVHYRHLETIADAPPCTTIDGKEFRVRETRLGILKAGSSTSLTRRRDGMHGFVAGPKGARILDFTLSTTPDIETFSYVRVSPEPEDRAARTYRAVWLGKK